MCLSFGAHKGHSSVKPLDEAIAFEKDRLSAALERCVSEIEKLQRLGESRSEFVAALLRQEERFLDELHSDVESCVEAVRAKEVEVASVLRAKVARLVREIGADLAPVTDSQFTASALCVRAEETQRSAAEGCVAGASFVCSAREVLGLLEASVKRSSELMVCRSSAPFDLASVRYLKPPLEGCLAVDESGGWG
jgi:hypothetical protein